jgi:hypothetical protein
MAATTAIASRIHGHTGVEDEPGAGEVVAVGTGVTELAELVWGAGVLVEVVVVVEVEVEVFVAVLVVEVFVGALVVEVLVGVDVEVRVGASPVGGLVVRVGIGVRDGSVGRLSERDALGRFEPPPHDAIQTSSIARNPIEEGLVLLVSLLHLFELRTRAERPSHSSGPFLVARHHLSTVECLVLSWIRHERSNGPPPPRHGIPGRIIS